MKGEQAIKILWQTLFPVKFAKGEYAEVIYDDGDRHFKYALHIETLEELEEFIREYNEKVNFAICPNTREPKRLAKRTGYTEIKRQKAILIDIEDPESHTLKKPEEVRHYIIEFAKSVPESIRKAVKFSAYTGGGGLICIELSRWVERGEIEIVYDWLRERVKDFRYVDKSSLNPAQAQRLIGTINAKYKVETFIFKLNENCESLDVDAIITEFNARQNVEIERHAEIERHKGKIKNIEEIVREIKKRIKFKDLGLEGEDYGYYERISCPFHPPDRTPSFVIYHNGDGDVGVDFHTGEAHDIIGIYQKLYEKDFITAVRELAQRAGIKVVLSSEEKKKLQKEQALADFDPHAYITEELKIRSAIRYRINGEYHFDFFVENREGEVVKLSESLFKLQEWRYSLRLFGAHTGYKPAPLPAKAQEEAWELVIDALFEVSEKDEEFDKSELPWELEELQRVIREAPATDIMDDFVLSKSRYVKLVVGDTVYVSLTALLRRLKINPTFERINLKKVSQLLRELGAKPERIYVDGYRIRAWRLPEGDWRVVDTMDTTGHYKGDGSVHKESLETRGADGFVDTMDTIEEDEKKVMKKNSIENGCVVSTSGHIQNVETQAFEIGMDTMDSMDTTTGGQSVQRGDKKVDEDDDDLSWLNF
ncbi:hypothetical protein Hydth_0526 [Hydrogenobacter thermophilus TK-6]|uniref:Uncharacterized protein n=1 Tax=Hydrogenobacter thermophilus (strain DSM 6534 / IAM 12695 / TK-6) TaxID=608538 RepID=D3DGP0_HYDTT|nr:hypothetical protein [Hydrogenobacter thermophilus]ADO44926.1 hypothetical protein Hydth_0526 [Hydrogenobacter thermophilus TK-6]BAI68992.1 hypothetical protein HTH_0529 [Hydrogenobacter thermophilus TK-6]